MNSNHEEYMRRCYELAISAGKKGFDTFRAVLVSADYFRLIIRRLIAKDFSCNLESL